MRTRRIRRSDEPLTGAEASQGVAYLKERTYATFTGLAIVLVVDSGGHVDARHAFLALVLGVVGIVVAGTVSEFTAHLVVHRGPPHGAELAAMARVAGGAVATVVLPAVLLGLAWAQVLPVGVAVDIVKWTYIATLAAIGLLAVRGGHLSLRYRVIVLSVLVGLGLAVVGVQALAKSV